MANGGLFRWLLWSLGTLPLLSDTTRFSGLILYVSCPSLGISPYSKESWSVETKVGALGVLSAIGV